ncbi:MAG: toprim domain-containing protein [Planctomycetes bacterium]|nr:toprim domain-containing protein [Planctomycetota bacterium]
MSTIKDIKRQVSIARVLESYNLGAHLKRRGDQLIGPCPLHGGDNPTAFRVHLTRGLWNCFTACGGGDVLDLIRAIEKCSKTSALHILQRMISATPAFRPFDAPLHPDRPTPEILFRPFRRRIRLDPRAPFLQESKGILVETASRFEAGLPDPRSTFLQGTLAVRLHDMKGHPIGYCGRRLDPDTVSRWGKWRFPARLPKGRLLYNAHRALPHRNRGIVLVECPWAAMRLTQAGVPGVVALLGTTATNTQLAWLAEAPAVLLLLDGDQAGYTAAKTIAQSLTGHTTVHTQQLPPDKEPEDLSDTGLALLVKETVPFSLNPPLPIRR